MSTFNLKKGESFQLTKATTKFRLGLGWDEASGNPIDLDAHAFGCVLVGGSPKMFNGGSHSIGYFNKVKSNSDGSFETQDGSVKHSGDNLTGAGDGDDESITIDTSKLPSEIDSIEIFLTIYEAGSRGQSFSNVKNSHVHMVDESGTELFRYDLANEFAGVQSIQVGSLVKDNGIWKFEAVGAGFNQDLGAIIARLS